MSRPTQLTIDLAALNHNFKCIRRLAPNRSVIAMVKANAYGHGLIRVATALPDVDAFGVASLEEGIMLRDAGIKQEIVLMEGLFSADELTACNQYQFTLVVHHERHLEMLAQSNIRAVRVWLKINTGMHRLGIQPDLVETFYQRLSGLNGVQKPIGLMTHLAEADDKGSLVTRNQITKFNSAIVNLTGPISIANSAGILAWPEAHGDWVRPGLMLYGASPFVDRLGIDLGLKPVMTLSSKLIAITSVKAGQKVGYGGTWTARCNTKIGVIGVGYGDGYPQFAINGTPVLVNGMECPLAGRVSMDMLTVDLRNQPKAAIDDPVVLWGVGLPVERVAKYCRTSAYEILTRMTPRPKIAVKSTVSVELSGCDAPER